MWTPADTGKGEAVNIHGGVDSVCRRSAGSCHAIDLSHMTFTSDNCPPSLQSCGLRCPFSALLDVGSSGKKEELSCLRCLLSHLPHYYHKQERGFSSHIFNLFKSYPVQTLNLLKIKQIKQSTINQTKQTSAYQEIQDWVNRFGGLAKTKKHPTHQHRIRERGIHPKKQSTPTGQHLHPSPSSYQWLVKRVFDAVGSKPCQWNQQQFQHQ